MKLKVSSSKSEEKKEGPLKNKDLGDNDAPVLTIHSVLTKDSKKISPKPLQVLLLKFAYYTISFYAIYIGNWLICTRYVKNTLKSSSFSALQEIN